jgi:hypothetical protein
MEKSIGRDETLASPLGPSSIITDTLLGLLKATYLKFNTGLLNPFPFSLFNNSLFRDSG